ncbi:MAG: HD domain-containing phosphohydrolase [Desulfobacca sp.]|uniref:HD domain-containing phosphohydrolase n=1 Tax=Desulfobacca sp. TaxID=2067990 RepID=UPI00404A42DC
MRKQYNIMVADDEPAVREVVRDLILALGQEYIVYTAADSSEALQLLRNLSVDLALVDIFMPGQDGFALIKEMRAKHPGVMIVVITGQPNYNMVLEALRSGAKDFLAKPVALNELRKILATLKATALGEKTAGTQTAPPQPDSQNKPQGQGGTGQEQQFFQALSEQLASIRSAGELYTFLTDMALSLSGGTWANFYLYDQEQGRLTLVSQSGALPSSHGPGPKRSKLSEAEAAKKQEDGPPSGIAHSGFISFPLKLRGHLLGVLHVYQPPQGCFQPEAMAQLHLLAERFVLALENLTLQESVFRNLYDTLRALINSLEARDASTRHHSVRVTSIAAKFAERIGLPKAWVDSLRRAGALHDIGKIGIPDAVLLKPAPLMPAELEIIRQHPVIGANIVAPLHLLPREQAIIVHHHERWDGKGYPSGLAGEAIPLLARIIALADSYDAIISDRPYRARRSHDEALAEIAAHAGTQFDPELTRQFIEIMSRPLTVQELQNLDAELQTGKQLLSEQEFQRLLRNFNQKTVLRRTRQTPSPLHS